MSKNVCVYCGSRTPQNPVFIESAVQTGISLAQNGWGLVYGGGKVGMMGLVANATLEHGGEVIGVIPTALKKEEVVHTGLTELHETQDMHTRKALMEARSDAFIVLPGGFGTLDEFFEILTWRQLGFHDKPIYLLNVDGYFDGLKHFFERALETDFIRQHSLDLLRVSDSVTETMEMLTRDFVFTDQR